MPLIFECSNVEESISAVLNPKAHNDGGETLPTTLQDVLDTEKIMELGFKLLAVIVLVIYVFLLQPKRYI
jgi:hypothetical protein